MVPERCQETGTGRGGSSIWARMHSSGSLGRVAPFFVGARLEASGAPTNDESGRRSLTSPASGVARRQAGWLVALGRGLRAARPPVPKYLVAPPQASALALASTFSEPFNRIRFPPIKQTSESI